MKKRHWKYILKSAYNRRVFYNILQLKSAMEAYDSLGVSYVLYAKNF